MNKNFEILEFKTLSTPEKISFLENDFVGSIINLEEKTINSSMREIILDEKENSFVRKIGLELFTDLVVLGKLKIRQGLSLLIDDWIPSSEIFIELQRLKDLYLYYDDSNEEIEIIYQQKLNDSEAELVSESLLNLGLINFQKALTSTSEEECSKALTISESYFIKSYEELENRIDSNFYFKVVSILGEIINNRWGSAKEYIRELGNILFQREVFSFDYKLENLQFSFYKILTSLQKLCNKQPNNWLDYRSELDNVYLCYSEITNSTLKQRLNENSVASSLGNFVSEKIFEPYFMIHFSSEITKLNVRLGELQQGTEEHNFLSYLKSVIENNNKKKVELDSLGRRFKNLFPTHNQVIIEQLVNQIVKPSDCLKAFETLTNKSNSELVDSLIFASAKMQGDKKYWANNSDENERNKYLANLVEARGFSIKDQTQWSTSNEGKKSGEIDIFITEKDGSPKSIIEALILDSLKTDYIILHLDKLFRYDTTGLENNYIITYSTAKDFAKLWNKYKAFISKHVYNYKFIDYEEINDYNFTDIKIGVAKHLRNGKKIKLYHIMINLSER
ncbi:hypothetical protein [Gelidibacter salicanalis]|uniref:Uncharacterized protein n=1 Tax=Gelidibacter salicanalis TaxID=291193 RepID=A0A934KX83_9FLAO|nr:hypothetical protein [Gelidibacter salicanalis]MBJ7880990.1 hypothetical protein [Gelidibacter salicanalis]